MIPQYEVLFGEAVEQDILDLLTQPHPHFTEDETLAFIDDLQQQVVKILRLNHAIGTAMDSTMPDLLVTHHRGFAVLYVPDHMAQTVTVLGLLDTRREWRRISSGRAPE
ncbi:hypothetical protein LRH25_23895 [Ideonella azotifigens]|uniref:Type II toxin-antitoxin system RelE/ParE family toxin n=1 Tax=Ideonella azotifigens TaxID=513160 RepID=A0ABN1KMG5_9BURK|nr:hypothetical protein [Ideonella azotifigens]MCD2343375.1 hypothetical protein [Ideonella azotifigens]